MSNGSIMLNGKIVKDVSSYSSKVTYKNIIEVDDERQILLDEIKKCEKIIAINKRTIEGWVKNDFTPKGLPASFAVRSVSIQRGSVEVEWCSENGGFDVEIIDPPSPFDDQPKEEDPFKQLGKHHSLIQILNCGALTKEEKRKVLGLPEQKSEKELKS